MGIIELILVGAGLAMDALAVSIAKGLAVPRASLRGALWVGLWFGGFQALMPLVGWALGITVLDLIATVDHWIAFGLLALSLRPFTPAAMFGYTRRDSSQE